MIIVAIESDIRLYKTIEDAAGASEVSKVQLGVQLAFDAEGFEYLIYVGKENDKDRTFIVRPSLLHTNC